MPKISKSPVCFPPSFPLEGRLSPSARQVNQNLRQQTELERKLQDDLSLAAGFRVMPPCCKTLHISLFFDGTGNNLNHDLYESTVAHPTNIARLFRATIGAGHAGGTAHNPLASGLTDASGIGYGQYYKYYMPGVGTPFPEVGDLDYNTAGLAFAQGGERRINWALLMVIDALRRSLNLPRLDNAQLMAAVEAMGTWRGTEWILGRSYRRRVFREQLKAIEQPLRIALAQPSPGHPKLVGIKLYVYGFSRGAAAARAFVSWLNELLVADEAAPALPIGGSRLPVSVDYLGLLDTVVSVGLADLVPVANGHMGWGDGSQELPRGALVKRCLHIVASHEQRLSFPLESIRREDGTYPDNSVEVIYPGVHSDQGGGYVPGDQGKAWSQENVEGDGLLLSQIALQDMYGDAYAQGAPLKIPKDLLPSERRSEAWRAIAQELLEELDISPLLTKRFNGWRHLTLGLQLKPELSSFELSDSYQPIPANVSLEDALRTQMDWLTAWRIDRYAFESLKDTDFYLRATDEHATPEARARGKVDRDNKQAQVMNRRALQQDRERRGAPKLPLEPGIPSYDPDKSKTQLREAAQEFGRIYRNLESDPYLLFFRRANKVYRPALIIYWLSSSSLEQCLAEHKRMKAGGRAKVSQLFPPPAGQQNHATESLRGEVDEAGNRDQPAGLLRALFDDHVHDSRAWFLHASLNDTYLNMAIAGGREPLGSYFTERMVFFGDANRRDLALMTVPVEAIDSDASIARADINLNLLDAERAARIQRDIADMWAAHYAESGGGHDGQS